MQGRKRTLIGEANQIPINEKKIKTCWITDENRFTGYRINSRQITSDSCIGRANINVFMIQLNYEL